MHYLALDIGTKRTGVAFADSNVGIAHPLATITHESFDALEEAVVALMKERTVDHLVIGLPFLLSGVEGEQAATVRLFTERLVKRGMKFTFVDERYTTTPLREVDGNAAAASHILTSYLAKPVFNSETHNP